MIRQLFKGVKSTRPSFRYFSNAAVDTRPQFLVGEENGFLPRKVSNCSLVFLMCLIKTLGPFGSSSKRIRRC